MSRETIKVCCRFRKEFDHPEEDYDKWIFEDETSTIYYGDKFDKNCKKWTYDYILPPETTQEQMNEKVAKKTVLDFTDGYNGTIFAYGQSGSGKTYSMLGHESILDNLSADKNNELYGIIPRAVFQIFDILNEFTRNGTKWKLTLSYIEIYNEKIKCLLSKKDGLKIREDPHDGFIIPEKDTIDCLSPSNIFEGIKLANKNRATGATNQNEHSSRSHAILQLQLIYNSIDGQVRKSFLSLVDLAGSERIAKTGAEGQRLKEAQKINQSLTTLGMVIMALTTPGTKHVPFRNSKLTLILKDSLGGSSKTTLLCTASRLKKHSEESIQTLYFASRAKTIKTHARKNIILSAGELQYLANGLKKEILLLRGQIKKIGFQWHLIDDKKIINFCNNDEFITDGTDLVQEKNSNENKSNTNNKTNNKDNSKKGETLSINESEKDKIIEELKESIVSERELMQLIIDELNEKVGEKDEEISELKQQLIKCGSSTGNNITITNPSAQVDVSKYEKEIKELRQKLSEKDSQIKLLMKEKEDLSEQNIYASQENRKNRVQITELLEKIEELQKVIDEQNTIKKNLNPNRGSAFGVTLKKVDSKGINYLEQAYKDYEKQKKEASLIFKNSSLYNELHKYVQEKFDSPKTVSSNNDILDMEIPDLDFGDIGNEEVFKKFEEELYAKEIEHKKQKEEKNKIEQLKDDLLYEEIKDI